jgi:hypothetical protein
LATGNRSQRVRGGCATSWVAGGGERWNAWENGQRRQGTWRATFLWAKVLTMLGCRLQPAHDTQEVKQPGQPYLG